MNILPPPLPSPLRIPDCTALTPLVIVHVGAILS